jgi:hypothetical protein
MVLPKIGLNNYITYRLWRPQLLCYERGSFLVEADMSLIFTFVCRHYSSLEVASEYFRSGADKISIGSDAVYAAEEYLKTGVCASTYEPRFYFCQNVLLCCRNELQELAVNFKQTHSLPFKDLNVTYLL